MAEKMGDAPDQTDAVVPALDVEGVPGDREQCAGCLHFYGDYENNRCCNYIFDVGHRRPCPPGKACTVKRPIRSVKELKLRKARGFV